MVVPPINLLEPPRGWETFSTVSPSLSPDVVSQDDRGETTETVLLIYRGWQKRGRVQAYLYHDNVAGVKHTYESLTANGDSTTNKATMTYKRWINLAMSLHVLLRAIQYDTRETTKLLQTRTRIECP